jgi:ribonuclease PH
MKRNDNRLFDQLRKVNITRNFIKHAEGSCLIEFGNTKIICTASVDEKVPPFLRNSGKGWLTAEYGMLPRSTNTRIQRERDKLSGRTMEIQRLVGRALRNVTLMNKIGERTIVIDCDVMQADGGTRVASIVGGFVALVDCMDKLYKSKKIPEICITDYLAAISVGIIKGKYMLDLDYDEDSAAEVDMNVVMKSSGEFIELQGTGEHGSFNEKDLSDLLALGKKGINEIIAIEKELFKGIVI